MNRITWLRIALGSFLLLALLAPVVFADSENEMQSRRDGWQSDYRELLLERKRYEYEIAQAQKDYVLAQRRNYPRGGARQAILLREQDAKAALAETEEKIQQIFVDARAAMIPPGWLLMVEDENLEYAPAAADPAGDPDLDDDDDDGVDTNGRNPIYFEFDDD